MKLELSEEVVNFIDNFPQLVAKDNLHLDMDNFREYIKKHLVVPTAEFTLYMVISRDEIKEWHLSGDSSTQRNYGFCSQEEKKEVLRIQREEREKEKPLAQIISEQFQKFDSEFPDTVFDSPDNITSGISSKALEAMGLRSIISKASKGMSKESMEIFIVGVKTRIGRMEMLKIAGFDKDKSWHDDMDERIAEFRARLNTLEIVKGVYSQS